MPKRGEKGGEIIHCTDGNKNEVHPAVDIGGREERDDGTYRRIRWVTNDEYTWVHESRVVTLSRKRQRSKTQRWSGDGATLPSTAKQARNDDDESSSAASNAGRRNRSKRTPKAPTRRSASVRRITGMKSKVTIPKPMCLSEISMHSDDDDDLSSIDDDDRKPAYRELTTTNSRRSTRSKRQKRPGNMASPIDLCSDDEKAIEQEEPQVEPQVKPEMEELAEEVEHESDAQVAIASNEEASEASSFFSIETQYFGTPNTLKNAPLPSPLFPLRFHRKKTANHPAFFDLTSEADDDEPVASDDEPSEADDEPFTPHFDGEDSPGSTRCRTNTAFYEPKRISPPKLSSQKQARKEARLTTKSSSGSAVRNEGKGKSLSRDSQRRQQAAILKNRWTAKSLRNANRYLLDAQYCQD